MESELNFSAIMERLKQATRTSKDKEVAEMLGLSITSFSNRKRTSAVPFEEICKAAITRKLNINWLFTGDGAPFLDKDDWVTPVAEINSGLLAEIAGELARAFDGEENKERLFTAAQRGALAAQIFNKVAFVKQDKVRSSMIREQAQLYAEAAPWLSKTAKGE